MTEGRKTTRQLRAQYEAGEPITMVTCYDYTFARLVEMAGIDMILIGDSLGNVIQGQETTLPVEVEDIIYHTRAVMRGNGSAHVVADMPFLSYQASADDALVQAGRLMKYGGAQSVKLEGGERVTEIVYRMTQAGIPVCGHLGLTPQSVHAFGGFRVQGREEEAARRMIREAKLLAEAGAFMVVLELVPAQLARRVTEAVNIPTIGIGAGHVTSGQVLVLYDLLGLNMEFTPKFLKRFATLEEDVVGALSAYREEVKARKYPGEEHSF
ncbi:MAG: 3-methyl-2-oxobutanoate hydroxymethyltransferase [Myxococcota bacterium]